MSDSSTFNSSNSGMPSESGVSGAPEGMGSAGMNAPLVGQPGARPGRAVVGDAIAEEPSPIEVISQRTHRIGEVAVTFTVGRIRARSNRAHHQSVPDGEGK